MKILFVSSGRKGHISPITQNQGASLIQTGAQVDYFVVNGRGWRSYLKSIKPLYTKMVEGRYNIIHAHYSWVGYLASIVYWRYKRISPNTKLVVSLMGNDVLDHWWYPILARFIASVTPWHAVIVKSADMKRRLDLERAIVLPNGVDMDKFHEMDKAMCQQTLGWTKENTKHILFPATPSEIRKNWRLAQASLKLLNEEKNGYTCELHAMVGVPNEQTPIWYNAADVVILPSFYEGSPNAVKEAMACGKPIVTTDMGDCRERLKDVSGCYVATTFEAKEFYRLIKASLQFVGKTNGRECVVSDGISCKQIADRLIDIYEN